MALTVYLTNTQRCVRSIRKEDKRTKDLFRKLSKWKARRPDMVSTKLPVTELGIPYIAARLQSSVRSLVGEP